MSQWSIQFDPPDLAGWLWLAVWIWAGIELIRYLLRGRRPARAEWRLALCAGGVGLTAVGWAAGAVQQLRWHHPVLVAIIGGLAASALIRAYRETTRSVSRPARLALLSCRLAALGVILVLLARPVVEYVSVTRERSTLAVLLDDSRSMTVRDVITQGEPADPESAASRMEALTRCLADNRDALAVLAQEVDLRYFGFDAHLREFEKPALSGRGEHTALAGALEQARTALTATGGKPAGLVLVSDGRDNLSTDDEQRSAPEALAAAGIPLYTVGIGSEQPTGPNRSLVARRLDCPESVAVLNRLPVRGQFVASGLAGVPITVELVWDDMIVDTRELRPAQPQELLRTDFEHIPIAGGLHRVTLRARMPEMRTSPAEAALTQFVRVTDEKIQVLFLDRPRYERAAIARALEAAPEVRVTKVDLGRPAAGATSLNLPRTAVEWQAYHVVLIGDVEPSAFNQPMLEALRDLVREHGRGMALLGGIRTLGGGRLQGSPLGELGPVSLGTTGQLAAPVQLELTAAGRQHAICRLAADPAAGERLWKRLSLADGAVRLAGLVPTAEVLMRTPAGEPLLVISESGQGRVAAVAFDSTWRWSFGDPSGVEAQRRFWRQLVIWLANRRPEVWVASDKPRYDLSRLRSAADQVTLRAGVSDPTTGRMPEGAALSGTIAGATGPPAAIRWVKTGETLEARPAIRESGEYRVKVSAKAGGALLGESEAAFVVSAPDPELGDSTADLENLRRLAAATRAAGGEYVPLSEFGRLIERLSAQRPAAEIRRIRRENVVDERPWGFWGLFVGLLTVEWIVRRRLGLV